MNTGWMVMAYAGMNVYSHRALFLVLANTPKDSICFLFIIINITINSIIIVIINSKACPSILNMS